MKNLKAKLIVTNLLGKVILKEVTKDEAYKFIFGVDYNKDKNSKTLMCGFFVNRKYIVLRTDDKEKLYDRLKKVILVVSKEKDKIINAYSSIISAKKSGKFKVSRASIKDFLDKEKFDKKDGVYFISGQEGVNLLKKLGYLSDVLNLLKGDKENNL